MKVEICPECGSNKVEKDVLGLEASCLACSWKSNAKKLVTAASSTDAQEVAEKIAAHYLLELSQRVAPEIGRAMVATGVIGGKEPRSTLARLIRAATLGAHKATLTEIEQIQTELRNVTTV